MSHLEEAKLEIETKYKIWKEAWDIFKKDYPAKDRNEWLIIDGKVIQLYDYED